jgi:putative transposase
VKRFRGGYRQRQITIYKYIDKQRKKFSVSFLCDKLNITQSSYYRWVAKGKNNYTHKIDKELMTYIQNIFIHNKGLYGSPRIQIVLENDYGIKVSTKKIWRYMKIASISSFVRKKRKYRKPPEIKVRNVKYDNIVKRQWKKYNKAKLFVTDVTYIPYGSNRYAYLSIMKDVKTNFIVGAVVSKKNDIRIYMDTIKQAECHFNKDKSTIIHSDNGFQYTSYFAQRYCEDNNIIISLNKPGTSLDNAACETFFSSLKTENPELRKARSFEEIKLIVDDYIEYYNYQRIVVKNKSTPWVAWCA